mmetsp:Transcript_32849/g.59519  ORF Transcript_32849/g.59519 Transcript_32849/m.59519 type:complete len:295 (-) Transcript_32849:1093-1977(-)|eukprot:CAMPEP_0175084242 /NCGR_PEP_ID=MMETSP0052_2-20121109/27930_1 /TAXON_ID=51329 ORGANISM="Polytomella parva, Strain SAG 63-3" /NCGR_SAMPLE_ID=MMETSP0052_2 /ASSEMBLY_ACC=CAM_ASM_000194 /LENGTH=294 /DNA_ID=CAMNT_0016355983 /DNA_START=93 /DNA_END=977 /DNA_ORIENTATION=+
MSSEEFTEVLKANGVEFVVHPDSEPQTLFKTQFFKDKKHRCYFIFALATTKYNIKVLSARLGLGKGGLVEASSELIASIFKGPISLTGLSSPAASETLLLIDESSVALPADSHVTLPLPGSGFISLPFGGAAIEKLAKSALGLRQTPIVTDLLSDPKIDRENPPDLKPAADALNAVPAAVPSTANTVDGAAGAPSAPTSTPTTSAASPASAKKEKAKGSSTAAGPKASVKSESDVAAWIKKGDVSALTDHIISTVAGDKSGELPVSVANDLTMLLRSLYNNAYTSGFVAGKGSK